MRSTTWSLITSLHASLLFFNVKPKQAPRTSKPRLLSRSATHGGFIRHGSELKDARDDDVGFGKRTSRVALAVLLAGLAVVPSTLAGASALWIKMHRHQLDDVMDSLRQTMLRDSFVHVDGATFRELLVWQGADPSDLNAIEMGKIHAATEQDKEPTMAFRQVAFHRMVSLQGKPFQPAQYRAITQIAEKEITSDVGARVYFERSGTRKWNLPPSSYAQSSLPAALARVNTLLMSDWQHSDQANLKQDQSTVINDQILIKVNKLSDSEESPTPEGVHQDGTEVSSVTMIERKGIQHGGESRFWSTDAPTGNYDGIGANGQPIVPPAGFSWSHSLANITLEQPWESLFFIDRKVKHEVRPFDGERPCHRSVIVQFIRKPVKDGSDKMLLDL